MSSITSNSFKTPVIGTDPITKGTFRILWATALLDYDEEEIRNVRATGSVVIDGFDNPLFDAIQANPLRVQGLIASVLFSDEKRFIKFMHVSDYSLQDDGVVRELELSLVFTVLDNLEYLEAIPEYRYNNLL